MKKLRKNASLANIVQHARRLADKARKTWKRLHEQSQTHIISNEEHWRLDGAWDHFADLDEVATHLERFMKEA